MALVDTDTLHVEGYFEETKLPRIHLGNAVRMHLMGDSGRLSGHVESIAAGIEDRDRAEGSNLLANVNPTVAPTYLLERSGEMLRSAPARRPAHVRANMPALCVQASGERSAVLEALSGFCFA